MPRNPNGPTSPGDRVRLDQMGDDPEPVEPGTEGTVTRVHQAGGFVQVSVEWDNGRHLMLVSDQDRWTVV